MQMKSFLLILSIAMNALSSSTAEFDPSSVPTACLPITMLVVSNPECPKDLGIDIESLPAGKVNQTTLLRACSISSCVKFFDELKAKNVSGCKVPIGGTDTDINTWLAGVCNTPSTPTPSSAIVNSTTTPAPTSTQVVTVNTTTIEASPSAPEIAVTPAPTAGTVNGVTAPKLTANFIILAVAALAFAL